MSDPVRYELSIVICSIDAGKYARVCANYRALFPNRDIELIGIHDARSLAEGYNRGIARARGNALILSHDDVEILSADFASRVGAHLSNYDAIGIAGTTRVVAGRWAAAGDPYIYTLITSPHEDHPGYATALLGGGSLVVPGIEALDGVFVAMRSEVARAVPFDAETFDGFHLYDLDWSLRAHRAGFRLAVCRDIVLIHESTGRYDADWERYRLRFESKHRGALHAIGVPKEGARAWFSAATREEILRCCDPARLAAIAAEIGRANARL